MSIKRSLSQFELIVNLKFGHKIKFTNKALEIAISKNVVMIVTIIME